ncbi:MAG TPA: hypothetical protein VNA88_01750 [Candidatus Kapabacteria bacterium]|nr:hypothetical protein [Candidatus Kapabacteria bacterium]
MHIQLSTRTAGTLAALAMAIASASPPAHAQSEPDTARAVLWIAVDLERSITRIDSLAALLDAACSSNDPARIAALQAELGASARTMLDLAERSRADHDRYLAVRLAAVDSVVAGMGAEMRALRGAFGAIVDGNVQALRDFTAGYSVDSLTARADLPSITAELQAMRQEIGSMKGLLGGIVEGGLAGLTGEADALVKGLPNVESLLAGFRGDVSKLRSSLDAVVPENIQRIKGDLAAHVERSSQAVDALERERLRLLRERTELADRLDAERDRFIGIQAKEREVIAGVASRSIASSAAVSPGRSRSSFRLGMSTGVNYNDLGLYEYLVAVDSTLSETRTGEQITGLISATVMVQLWEDLPLSDVWLPVYGLFSVPVKELAFGGSEGILGLFDGGISFGLGLGVQVSDDLYLNVIANVYDPRRLDPETRVTAKSALPAGSEFEPSESSLLGRADQWTYMLGVLIPLTGD